MCRSSGPWWRRLAVRREIPQHPLGHILDVRGALAEEGIRNPPHGFEEILHHRVERVFGVLLAVDDGVEHPLDHRPVFEHHHVRLENPALIVSGKVFQPALELDQLAFGDFDRLP